MANRDSWDEWAPRAGKLDESAKEAWMILGGGRSNRHAFLPTNLWLRAFPRSIVGVQSRSYIATAKLGNVAIPRGRRKLACFHFSHTSIGRVAVPGKGRSNKSGGNRTYIFPTKREAHEFRKDPEATYHKRSRCWSIPNSHPLLSTPKGMFLATEAARLARYNSFARGKSSPSPQRAIAFQKYIERIGNHSDKREEVECDAKGPISLGTIGANQKERIEFWQSVIAQSTRLNARLQNRLIAELPHWVDASDRRCIAEKFGKFLSDHGLGWWAVAHRPNAENGGDRRNFHMHLLYFDGLLTGWNFGTLSHTSNGAFCRTPIFADRKDRMIQSKQWIALLRKKFSEIVNEQITEHARRTQRTPPFRFFPGTLKDLGIDRPPMKHLGPKGTALARRGFVSYAEATNAEEVAQQSRLRLETEVRRLIEVFARLEKYENDIRPDLIFEKYAIYSHEFKKVQTSLCETLEKALEALDPAEQTAISAVEATCMSSGNIWGSRARQVLETARHLVDKKAARSVAPLSLERIDNALTERTNENKTLEPLVDRWRRITAACEDADTFEDAIRRRKIVWQIAESGAAQVGEHVDSLSRMLAHLEALHREWRRQRALLPWSVQSKCESIMAMVQTNDEEAQYPRREVAPHQRAIPAPPPQERELPPATPIPQADPPKLASIASAPVRAQIVPRDSEAFSLLVELREKYRRLGKTREFAAEAVKLTSSQTQRVVDEVKHLNAQRVEAIRSGQQGELVDAMAADRFISAVLSVLLDQSNATTRPQAPTPPNYKSRNRWER